MKPEPLVPPLPDPRASDSTGSEKTRPSPPPFSLSRFSLSRPVAPQRGPSARNASASDTTRGNLRRRHFHTVTSPPSTPRFQPLRSRLTLPRAGVLEGLGHGRSHRRGQGVKSDTPRSEPLAILGDISTQVDEERARLETGPRRDAAGRVDGPPPARSPASLLPDVKSRDGRPWRHLPLPSPFSPRVEITKNRTIGETSPGGRLRCPTYTTYN